MGKTEECLSTVGSWGVLGSRAPFRTWPKVKIQARMERRAPAQAAAGSSGGFGKGGVFSPSYHRLGTEQASNTSGDFQPGSTAAAGAQTPRSRNRDPPPILQIPSLPVLSQTGHPHPGGSGGQLGPPWTSTQK